MKASPKLNFVKSFNLCLMEMKTEKKSLIEVLFVTILILKLHNNLLETKNDYEGF
jgi:hypothetical protein